jgi:hypothetical protein
MNVILGALALATPGIEKAQNSQMRVNSRYVSLDDLLRQRRQPPLWLPFIRIRTPELRGSVARPERSKHDSALWDVNLLDILSIDRLDWL